MTAKTITACASTILRTWQIFMLNTYEKNTERLVFSAVKLDALKEIPKTGEKFWVLQIILSFNPVAIVQLGTTAF
jgi:hypothetical protein